jgi:uncharacterized protein YukE
MSKVNRIKDIAEIVKTNKSATVSKSNTYDRSASSLSNTWKGESGEAYKDVARRVKTQMSSAAKDYDDLYTQLTKLSALVKRAEEEEKKKAVKK